MVFKSSINTFRRNIVMNKDIKNIVAKTGMWSAIEKGTHSWRIYSMKYYIEIDKSRKGYELVLTEREPTHANRIVSQLCWDVMPGHVTPIFGDNTVLINNPYIGGIFHQDIKDYIEELLSELSE